MFRECRVNAISCVAPLSFAARALPIAHATSPDHINASGSGSSSASDAIAAALRRAGVADIDVPFNMLRQMIHHPLTETGIVQFRKDWQAVPAVVQSHTQ